MDRFEMFNSMVNRTPVTFDMWTIIVNSIVAEDGSGKNFIVTGQHVGFSSQIKLFVRFGGTLAVTKMLEK